MNRSLTAGVALAAALGTAGLALAQSTVPNATQNPAMTTPQPAPSTGMPPGGGYQQPATGQQSLQGQEG
jgi:hypothetical protein